MAGGGGGTLVLNWPSRGTTPGQRGWPVAAENSGGEAKLVQHWGEKIFRFFQASQGFLENKI
jgi:hypothetical protein